MTDEIILAEPLPCMSCGSTSQDKVGREYTETKLNGGGAIHRPHDGLGGLKGFQTSDLAWALRDYCFPGFVPKEELFMGKNEYSKRFGGQEMRPPFEEGEICGTAICNMCDTWYDAKIGLRREGAIYLFTGIDLTCEGGIKAGILKTKTMDVIKSKGHIQLSPNDDIATRLYQEEGKKAEKEERRYKAFSNHVEGHEKILPLLEDYLAFHEKHHKLYENPLARATNDMDYHRLRARITKSAVKTMLIILNHDKPEEALSLLSASKLEEREKFEFEQRELYSWFFTGTMKTGIEVLVDCFYGPNAFLRKLRPGKIKVEPRKMVISRNA